MSEIGPVTEPRRIKSLDVMRGFAVLGILIVNAAFFAAPWQTSQNPLLPPLEVNGDTLWSWLIMHVFFEFKCITLFSLLFGVSVYLVGGERSDAARGAVLRRRLFWLLVFGLIHGMLIWFGDILVHYAIAGFLVLFVRSLKPAALLIVGSLLYVLALALQFFPLLTAPHLPPEALAEVGAAYAEMKVIVFAPAEETRAATVAAFQGGWASVAAANFQAWLNFLPYGVFAMLPRTVGVMLLGMGLFKIGFLSGRTPAWSYAIAALIGAGALAVVGYQAWLNWRMGFPFAHMASAGIFANAALSLLCSIGYAALLVLLIKAGLRLATEPLAAVGRMAFTNYIAQSLIMTTVFWGRGFGLFGEVDRPTLMAIVFVVWALQLIWSPLWLARFEMGPLEWLWRRLSYGRPVRIVKAAPV